MGFSLIFRVKTDSETVKFDRHDLSGILHPCAQMRPMLFPGGAAAGQGLLGWMWETVCACACVYVREVGEREKELLGVCTG